MDTVRKALDERDPDRRRTRRDGSRARRWDTRVGTVELASPRVGDALYFPSVLEPHRRAGRALHAVVQERTCRARQRAGSTSSSRRLGSRGPARARCPGSARHSTRGRRVPLSPPGRRGVPVPVARRDAAQGPPARTRARARGRHRRVVSGPPSSAGFVERCLRGMRLAISDDHAALVRRSGSSSSDRAGGAAGSTSHAMPRTSSPARPGAWSPQRSASCPSSPTGRRRGARTTRCSRTCGRVLSGTSLQASTSRPRSPPARRSEIELARRPTIDQSAANRPNIACGGRCPPPISICDRPARERLACDNLSLTGAG